MHLGLSLPAFTSDPQRPLAAADRALAQGFEAVFSVDHLFPPGSPDKPALEAFTLLAAAGAANPGLGVGLLITRVGMRSAGLLAKEAAALDHLSGGRAILGIGIGDAAGRAEHETLGIAFPPLVERIALLEDTGMALRALFAGAEWQGSDRVPAMTGPLLPPGRPAVWLAGTNERIVDAAGRAGDGWNGWGLDAPAFAARAARLREAASAAGRDPDAVLATWGGVLLVGEDEADLRRLQDARDPDLPWAAWAGTVEDLQRFAGDLEQAGCAWMIAAVAGGDERADLIASALAGR
jgi:alkanesulfonate monooxygenase SsuD/methylene tetrahydromethanopterin reductase-like flavin-dependent oxidoreductase (luciferase family)